jgi:hypothetical protein
MSYDLAKLSNAVLMHELSALVAQDRRTTARLLAHLAEVDFRRLYLEADRALEMLGGKSTSKSRSRYIPASIRNAVWLRDGGRCTFVAPDGHRCEATKAIAFDHIVPRSKGGETTLDNLRLRCRGHNQLAAGRVFGRRFMDLRRNRNVLP